MKSLVSNTVIAAIGLTVVGASHAGEVTIATGKLKGVTSEGVDSFKGIPFAAPPVGPLRWRAPQPAAAWTGVRDAATYGPDCVQTSPSEVAPIRTQESEDCLYLNVWRPTAATGKLPVMVWIYGGGFAKGGSSPAIYSGAPLARQGIIVVSFNYRLARFGTFAHPLLTKSNADAGLLGNYGYMDQVAALKWVQHNIAAFGGNPKNVTVVGESAGGMSVHVLVTSPLTDGLFSKAVIASGGDGNGMGGEQSLAAAERLGVAFARSKGIAKEDPLALSKLRALSTTELNDGPAPAAVRVAVPFIDGALAVDTLAAYGAGRFHQVPTMIGATSADLGGKTGFMLWGARHLAGVIADRGVPTYYYRFSYIAESARKSATEGVTHAGDLPYWFDTVSVKYGEATTARDAAVGAIVSGYLVNFVKTGDPNGPGLPRWQPYIRASDAMLNFAVDGGAVPGKDPWAADLDTVQDVPAATAAK